MFQPPFINDTQSHPLGSSKKSSCDSLFLKFTSLTGIGTKDRVWANRNGQEEWPVPAHRSWGVGNPVAPVGGCGPFDNMEVT
jgi:hypothetical protein